MKNIIFSNEQLAWVEEYTNYFVELIQQPIGETFSSQITPQIAQVGNLHHIVSQRKFKNLFRSWRVYKDQGLQHELGPVPLVFDIDDETPGSPNLHNAYRLTEICIEVLLNSGKRWGKVTVDQLRVVFSGKKGFHIEMKPSQPLDAQKVRRDLIDSCRKIVQNHNQVRNQFFGFTSIDIFHEHLRLAGSLNSWFDESGKICSRKVIQLSVTEFRLFNLERILKIAEAEN